MKRIVPLLLTTWLAAAGTTAVATAVPGTETPIGWTQSTPVLVKGAPSRAICGSTRGALTFLARITGDGATQDRMRCVLTVGRKVTVPEGISEIYVRTWGAWTTSVVCDLPAGTPAGTTFSAQGGVSIDLKPVGGISAPLASTQNTVTCTANGTDPSSGLSTTINAYGKSTALCQAIGVSSGQKLIFRAQATGLLMGSDTGDPEQAATASVALQRLRGTWSYDRPCN